MNTDPDRGALHNAVQHLVVLALAARKQLDIAMTAKTEMSASLGRHAFYQLKGATEELCSAMGCASDANCNESSVEDRWKAISHEVTAIKEVVSSGAENCCYMFLDDDGRTIVAGIELKLAMRSLDHVETMARDLAELLSQDEVVAIVRQDQKLVEMA